MKQIQLYKINKLYNCHPFIFFNLRFQSMYNNWFCNTAMVGNPRVKKTCLSFKMFTFGVNCFLLKQSLQVIIYIFSSKLFKPERTSLNLMRAMSFSKVKG